MSPTPIMLLSGRDLRQVLKPETTIAALHDTYAALAENQGDQGRSVSCRRRVHLCQIRASARVAPGLGLEGQCQSARRCQAPRPPHDPGIVVVSDAKDGRPLAVMDSIALTGIRTAATAALAARYGARRDSTRAAIIGCGAQAGYQLEALRSVFALRTLPLGPGLQRPRACRPCGARIRPKARTPDRS